MKKALLALLVVLLSLSMLAFAGCGQKDDVVDPGPQTTDTTDNVNADDGKVLERGTLADDDAEDTANTNDNTDGSTDGTQEPVSAGQNDDTLEASAEVNNEDTVEVSTGSGDSQQ